MADLWFRWRGSGSDVRRDEDVALAKRVLEGRHEWMEEGVLHQWDGEPWIATWEPGPSTKENLARRIM